MVVPLAKVIWRPALRVRGGTQAPANAAKAKRVLWRQIWWLALGIYWGHIWDLTGWVLRRGRAES